MASNVLVFGVYNLWLEALWAWLGVVIALLAAVAAIDAWHYVKLSTRCHQLVNRFESEMPTGATGERPIDMLLAAVDQRDQLLKATAAEHDGRYRALKADYTVWVHQIKTPIAALRLLIEGVPVAEQRRLTAELFRIERYVDMALERIRLESTANDLHIEQLALMPLLKSAVKKYKSIFIEKGIALTMPTQDAAVLSDKKWLGLAVEQILSNALKYTESGNIVITIAGDSLTIRDTGIGIMAEDLPRIFEAGYTGYNARSMAKSSGIGLNLAKRALDLLGHDIVIQSEVGVGTAVRIRW